MDSVSTTFCSAVMDITYESSNFWRSDQNTDLIWSPPLNSDGIGSRCGWRSPPPAQWPWWCSPWTRSPDRSPTGLMVNRDQWSKRVQWSKIRSTLSDQKSFWRVIRGLNQSWSESNGHHFKEFDRSLSDQRSKIVDQVIRGSMIADRYERTRGSRRRRRRWRSARRTSQTRIAEITGVNCRYVHVCPILQVKQRWFDSDAIRTNFSGLD